MSMLRSACVLIAGLALMAGPGSGAAWAHREHAGLTEVTVNPNTGEMEVVHRLFVHDLMEALGRDDQETADYVGSPEGLAEIRDYAARQFRLGEGDGRLIPLDYVGAEVDGEFTWIYFVGDPPSAEGGFLVDNDLLADHLDDQVMLTNLRFDSRVRTVLQGPGRRAPQQVSFD